MVLNFFFFHKQFGSSINKRLQKQRFLEALFPVAEPDLELSRGEGGVNLVPLGTRFALPAAFVPSWISSFVKGVERAPRAPPLDMPQDSVRKIPPYP